MTLTIPTATLEELAAEIPRQSREPVEDDLAPWRCRIDLIDQVVIRLLNERAVCASHIGAIKKHLGMPVYTPTREEDVLENVMGENPGPLSDQAVRRLYERIIDETRSLERHLYAGSDREPESD